MQSVAGHFKLPMCSTGFTAAHILRNGTHACNAGFWDAFSNQMCNGKRQDLHVAKLALT